MRWVIGCRRDCQVLRVKREKFGNQTVPIQTLQKPNSPAVAGLSGFLGENPIFRRIGGEVCSARRLDQERINQIQVQPQRNQTKKQFNELSLKSSAKTG
jgi:hypothetical protein